ncbi:inner membrane protein [Erythromicrobium ramosum]|uniref:Inner membrane protein n=1 Tax=Erythrobacter ramosus TaxID=35811 RepID=A0A6I4UKR0_9SPHN|nr:metal-dependent hydrolase [Erythrobacter ramosus]MBB3775884.1 inner membrane protein [Erythrobacter ramosus]MXP39026.1 metal-dependent hydrolase [Erythrobacter ramosus]
MDNLTHSLVGAVLGQAGLKRTTGLAMPALIIGANLPDVDAACFFWLHGTEHLAFRRGITHGPPALVLLPLVLAGMLWAFDRWQTKRGTRPEARLPVRFGWLYAMAFIGCLSHPFFDWLNVYGIRLLEPFSSQWFYGDTLFIIDVWLWALLIASLWWSRRREKAGAEWMRPARVGIAVGLAYIGVNAWISAKAVQSLPPYKKDNHFGFEVIASPVPFAFWERDLVDGYPSLYWHSRYRAFSGRSERQEVGNPCFVPGWLIAERAETDHQVEAFMYWSRAPFATRADDGSVILYDARFYDPLSRDRFSVALPDVKCEPLP